MKGIIGIYLDLTKAVDVVNHIYYFTFYGDMELEDTPMTFFVPIWPFDDSTRVQMGKNG